LSDKYITRLLLKKHKKADITPEMILEKRILILNPKPKMTYEELRAKDNKAKLERYHNNPEYKKAYLKRVSEYSKANKEKRRLSKLKLKEARTGF
jgi:hypothetical protein